MQKLPFHPYMAFRGMPIVESVYLTETVERTIVVRRSFKERLTTGPLGTWRMCLFLTMFILLSAGVYPLVILFAMAVVVIVRPKDFLTPYRDETVFETVPSPNACLLDGKLIVHPAMAARLREVVARETCRSAFLSMTSSLTSLGAAVVDTTKAVRSMSGAIAGMTTVEENS